MSILVNLKGKYACFTMPEFNTERVSYPVITPSSARNILDRIYWHPGVLWVIDRIYVCAPIRYMGFTTNEVSTKGASHLVLQEALITGSPLYLDADFSHTPRHSLVLKNVTYVVEAHIEIIEKLLDKNNSPEKINRMAMRRLQGGQQYRDLYFGKREFAAYYKLLDDETCIPEIPAENLGVRDFGYMLFDIDRSNRDKDGNRINKAHLTNRPMFYKAVMVDGCIDVPHPKSKDVKYHEYNDEHEHENSGKKEESEVLF